MAETSVLRSSASPRPMSPQVNNAGAQVQRSGPLPVVHVSMNNGRPQQSNGPGAQAPRNVTVFPPKGRLAGPQAQPAPAQIAAPAASALSVDQLMLIRHLLGEYAKAQGPEDAGNTQLAAETIAVIDQELATAQAVTSREQALADQRAAAAARRAELAPAPVQPRQIAVGQRSSQLSTGLAPRRIAVRPGAPPPVAVRMDGGQPVPEELDPETQDPSEI